MTRNEALLAQDDMLWTTEGRKRILALMEKASEEARLVVAEQADDEGLWFQPKYITEDYLQKALRRLHEAVEGTTSAERARAVLD